MGPVTPDKGRGAPAHAEGESDATPGHARPIEADSEVTVHTPPPRAAARDDDDDLAPGTMLGEYRVEGVIGRGGMGVVYTAVHPVIGKRAAVKLLNRELCRKAFAIERFVDEARVVNHIGHPNIVDVFAFGQTPDGRSYFVMEWLKGETLRERIARSRLELDEIREIVQPLTNALAAAHEQGVIHRDLKPDNVFLCAVRGESPRVKLLDFGIAKLAREEHRLERTATGAMVGTPQYIAPEQAKGHAIDHRADVYSLGAVLFELFTGRPPFVADNAMEVVAKHLMEAPVRPSTFASVLPELDDLVLAMLAKDPSARPSMVEVGAWFERTSSFDRTIVRTPAPVALAVEVERESSEVAVPPVSTRAVTIPEPDALEPDPLEPDTIEPHPLERDPLETDTIATTAAPPQRARRGGLVALALGIVVAGAGGFLTVRQLVAANEERPDPAPLASEGADAADVVAPIVEPPAAPVETAEMIEIVPEPPPPPAANDSVPVPSAGTNSPDDAKPAIEPKRVPIEKKRPRVVQPEPKRADPPKPQKRKLQLRIEGATTYAILIDGKPQGPSTEVSPGTHTIAVRADGMQPYVATVEVKHENLTWPVKLVKAPPPPPPPSDRDLLPKGSVK